MSETRFLQWTPALIERFWRAAYKRDLEPVAKARRMAPYLAAMAAIRALGAARIVELGSRDATLASFLIRAGHRVGRLNDGPLLALLPEEMRGHARWLGDLQLTEARNAEIVIAADVISRLPDDELPGFFAAARVMVKRTGMLCVTTPNNEAIASGLSVCPVTGKLFHSAQRLRSYDRAAVRDLLMKEGFAPIAAAQVELTSDALLRHPRPPMQELAEDDAYVGNGETLVVFARPERRAVEADVELANAWLAQRAAAAAATPEPKAEPFIWTPDNTRTFWNSIRGTPLDDQSFGANVGRALLSAIEPWLVPDGRHLDMGAGAGDVADLLLNAGYPVAALEASDGRRSGLEARLADRPNYLGTLNSLDGVEQFDVVLASEVIEHVDARDDAGFLGAIRRVLKPDGVLMISMPANEDGHASLQYSPEADVVFHRWQHLRSFSAERLADTLRANGFVCDVVHDIDFNAVTRGATPFFDSMLATTEPRRIGAGGTLVAIARPRHFIPAAPPPDARRIFVRRVESEPAYAQLRPASMNAEEIAITPAAAASVWEPALSLLTWIGAAYDSVSPTLRRLLPGRVKARLARFVPRIEPALAPLRAQELAEAGYLNSSEPLIAPDAFSAGPILLVNNALAWGGVERQVVNTLRGLEGRTQRALGLICLKLSEGGDYAFYLPALKGLRCVARDMAPLDEAKQRLAELFGEDAIERTKQVIGWMPSDVQENILRLMADFATLRPAVVHAWQDALSIEAAFAAKLVGVPRIITSARNMSPPNFAYFRPHQREAYRQIAACDDITMLSNSIAGARDYGKWMGIAPQRFSINRNGIDASLIKRAPQEEVDKLRESLRIPPTAQIVGSIFRFYDEKQPMLWMQIAADLAQRVEIAHFVVFGVGPRLEEARAYAVEHGFADRFHAPGTIEDAALGLSLFDVFMLTSKFEGTPNVVLEASCIGVPVVATPAGGTGEAVENHQTGWMVDPPDPEVMANYVCQALGDVEWREQCRQRGRQFVQERFGLERMIEETIDLYGMTEECEQGGQDVLYQSPERAAGE